MLSRLPRLSAICLRPLAGPSPGERGFEQLLDHELTEISIRVRMRTGLADIGGCARRLAIRGVELGLAR